MSQKTTRKPEEPIPMTTESLLVNTLHQIQEDNRELKADIREFRRELKADNEGLRRELKVDIRELKADNEGLRRELKADNEGLRSEVKADIRDLKADISTKSKWIIGITIASFISIIALIFSKH